MDKLLETLITTQPIDGCYLSTFNPPFDGILIKSIEDEAVKEHIIQVDSKNAGKLLFIIWKTARGFIAFGNKYPSSGFEEAQCNDCANGDPGLISVLAEVHRRKAYAWLCNHCKYCCCCMALTPLIVVALAQSQAQSLSLNRQY
jgi:hypothetical protein